MSSVGLRHILNSFGIVCPLNLFFGELSDGIEFAISAILGWVMTYLNSEIPFMLPILLLGTFGIAFDVSVFIKMLAHGDFLLVQFGLLLISVVLRLILLQHVFPKCRPEPLLHRSTHEANVVYLSTPPPELHQFS